MNNLTYMVILTWWLAGIVLAKGFWSVFFAICIPLYSMYLVVEKVMLLWGLV
jgi:hypothetical protein